MTDTARASWYRKSFGPIYLELYGHRDQTEAGRAVSVLRNRMPVAPGHGGRLLPVLDIACGAGRYLAAFREAGAAVVGLDLSPYLLAHAWRRAPGRVVRGDMRCLPFRGGAFGAAVSMFTSFGYFKGLDENQDVLEEAHRVTAPGGGLLIDYLNAAPTLSNLVPENDRKVGSWHVVERRRLEEGADGVDRIVKTVDVSEGERHVETLNEVIMALTPERLAGLAEGAGFSVIERLGDYDGGRFDASKSPRCILVCRREP